MPNKDVDEGNRLRRERYKESKNIILKRNKEYRDKNIDKVLSQKRNHYKLNIERIRESNRIYNKENIDKRRAYWGEYNYFTAVFTPKTFP